MIAQGDLLTNDGEAPVRQPVGPAYSVLLADPTTPTGLRYGGAIQTSAITGRTLLGYQAAPNVVANTATAYGFQSLFSLTTGENNAAFGSRSLFVAGTAANNSAFGDNTLSSLTVGNGNNAFGFNSLASLGVNASPQNTGNVAMGNGSGTNLGSGQYNSFFGHNSGGTQVSGDGNTFLGAYAGEGISAVSNAIIIRPATPSGPVVPVSGIVSGGCYIYNIANYNSSNGLDMQIDPTTNRIGVALSSRRFKENEALLDETEVRTKIAAMQPKSFNIIGQPGPDYGFIAEEMVDIYPSIVVQQPDENGDLVPYSIQYSKLIAILTKEIQRLATLTDDLQTRLTALETPN